MPTFQGVRTDHPEIIRAIQNMTKKKDPPEVICRVVGMPMEVVRSVQSAMKK
jgi:hypothetical protein